MKKTDDNNKNVGLDANALVIAIEAFNKSLTNGSNESESVGTAILAYLVSMPGEDVNPLRYGLAHTELPIEQVYPEIHDRYIAVQERNRALSILASSFEEMDWEGKVDVPEVALFLALVQNEIEGL